MQRPGADDGERADLLALGGGQVIDPVLDQDEGPAKRLSLAGMSRHTPMLDAPTLADGKVPDAPLAQHGFSALVEVRKGDRVRRLLFDTGVTPDGCADNLRRLGRDPAGIDAIVCSHGHFDHATGLSGLIAQLGRVNLPVLIHPEFWSRRRLAIPGGEPFELPTTSRRGLDEAGFDVIEQRQPSFLYDRSVLITGEVDRVTGFAEGSVLRTRRIVEALTRWPGLGARPGSASSPSEGNVEFNISSNGDTRRIHGELAGLKVQVAAATV